MEWPLAGNQAHPVLRTRWSSASRAARSARTLVPPLLLWVIAALYMGWVGQLAVVRHRLFESHGFDLGIYDQALWLISRGETPFSTVRGLHILGDHFTPILYPLGLLYRVGLGTEALLWTQTFALAVGAWPLYRMGSRLSGERWLGVAAGVCYLLYPPLRAIALFEFHPIALAIPGLLFALDFAFERRAVPMLAACFWSVLCKQEVAVVVACLGIWYAIRWRQPGALWLTGVGLAWFALAMRLTAHFAGTNESAYLELYSQYGNSTGEVLRTFLLTPWVPLARLGRYETWSYLLVLLAPLALLPLRSPGILPLLLFPLALNLFSNRSDMLAWWGHSVALLVPVLCAAATVAAGRPSPGRLRGFTAAAWVAAALLMTARLHAGSEVQVGRPALSAASARDAAAVLSVIPGAASVSATNNVLPHLTRRPAIFLFPNPFYRRVTGPGRRAVAEQLQRDAGLPGAAALRQAFAYPVVDYLVLGYRLPPENRFPVPREQWVRTIAEALRSPAYGLVADAGGVWVLRRGADHVAGLRRLGLCPGDPPARFEARIPRTLPRDPSPPSASRFTRAAGGD